MSDIHITITGPRGIGKTTLAKKLFQLFANSEYYVEEVEDTSPISEAFIRNMRKPLDPRVRAPRSITIEVRDYGFRGVDLLQDEDDDNV